MTEMNAVRQTVVPMLDYADGPTAMNWLVKAFGFVEQMRMVDDDGRLVHGELLASEGLIMVATATPTYEGPRAHREHCARAREWSDTPFVIDGVLVYVDDVDAHAERARAEGATILSDPEDGYPARRYRVEDIEGHRWMFMQR
jgi:uncharacterized glyoxalase superfamily protein PhnB